MKDKTLCVSFGHLNSLDAGLGEFANQLGVRLGRAAQSLQAQGVSLCFHMREGLHGSFGDAVSYIPYRPTQNFLPWGLPGCSIWHNAFQHNATLPPRSVRHRLLTVHDLNFKYVRTLGSWRDSALTRLVVGRSNGFATISRYVGSDVRRSMKVRGPVRTIYNGASDLSGMPEAPVSELLDRPFFFHLSRMAPSKNVHALIELARHWPEKTFVLAGPAWGHSQRLYDELHGALPNLVILLGVSDETKAWLLRHCDAFLFPSLTEGFGLPPIEAMYFGKPVFLSDRTCLPEIGGDFAGYFSDFSSDRMREVVERELPALRIRAPQIVEHAKNFSWERCANNYLSWYRELLSIT